MVGQTGRSSCHSNPFEPLQNCHTERRGIVYPAKETPQHNYNENVDNNDVDNDDVDNDDVDNDDVDNDDVDNDDQSHNTKIHLVMMKNTQI